MLFIIYLYFINFLQIRGANLHRPDYIYTGYDWPNLSIFIVSNSGRITNNLMLTVISEGFG